MQSKSIKIEHIHIEEYADEVPPPPPHLNSNFKSLQDWLFSVCDSKKPEVLISNYTLGFFESLDDHVLFLVGLNRHGDTNRIDFQPSDMYFQLPKSEYKNLTREELMNKLASELKDFTGTKKFKSSFLAQANSITLEDGMEIWSK